MAVAAARWAGLLAALLLSAGCAPAFQRRAQNVTVAPGRIVALPVLTMAQELSGNYTFTPQDAWAETMATTLTPEIGRWVAGNRGQTFIDEGATVPAVYPAFRRWTIVTLPEIAAQMIGRADFKLYSVDKWAFDRDLGRIKERLDADFVLVTFFRDTRRTAAHIVVNVLVGRHEYFLQVGVACLAELATGRMVWCNAKSDAWGDLSLPENAKKAVGELLTDLYYPPKPGTVAPAAARR